MIITMRAFSVDYPVQTTFKAETTLSGDTVIALELMDNTELRIFCPRAQDADEILEAIFEGLKRWPKFAGRFK